ncbi:MAG: type I glyceraldehyde-3-phosphate dehydrogenase [Planctomycetota bacterium]|jgi:glyceraldehyde 3-phosphate dehydrogenase
MAIKVGINGFGRIGRLVFRAMAERGDEFEVVGINDLADAATLGHLLKYDSVHGRYPGEVAVDGENIIADGRKIPVLTVRDPSELPWEKLGVEFAVESTGAFRTKKSDSKPGYDSHLDAGAKKVLLSVPAKDKIDATIVLGVNNEMLEASHKCVSNASCTTNCLAPVAKVLNDSFGIVKGLMTTIHAYTNDQTISDYMHKDLRRARAGAINVIPTTTGAAKAIGQVIPELDGKLNGIAMRVPVPTGSVVDLVCELKKDASVDEVNAAMKAAAEGPMKGIFAYCEDPIVSSDVIHDTHSSIFDSLMTQIIDKRMVKVVSWYDNEWGYSCRMADLMALAAKMG